jgi:pimeloyl-ACP methyl ester carboxylesterase
MPFRLAVFDMNAADGIQALYPQVENWYIGGHSLGGSMAASYLSDHTDDYNGLILCASYSTVDLSDTDLEIVSMYGDQDGILNMDNLKKNAANISTDNVLHYIIAGGNHAFFGMYGHQDGDGESSIGNVNQIFKAADRIVRTIKE